MSAFTDQRDRLVFHVGAVDTIARDQERIYGFNQYGDSLELYLCDVDGQPEVRAWEVAIDEEGIQHIRFQQGHRHVYFPWRIFGYQSLINEAEQAELDPNSFDDLVNRADSIADAIAGDQTLNGACLDMSIEPNISTPEPVTLGGGILVWGIDVAVTTYLIRT